MALAAIDRLCDVVGALAMKQVTLGPRVPDGAAPLPTFEAEDERLFGGNPDALGPSDTRTRLTGTDVPFAAVRFVRHTAPHKLWVENIPAVPYNTIRAMRKRDGWFVLVYVNAKREVKYTTTSGFTHDAITRFLDASGLRRALERLVAHGLIGPGCALKAEVVAHDPDTDQDMLHRMPEGANKVVVVDFFKGYGEGLDSALRVAWPFQGRKNGDDANPPRALDAETWRHQWIRLHGAVDARLQALRTLLGPTPPSLEVAEVINAMTLLATDSAPTLANVCVGALRRLSTSTHEGWVLHCSFRGDDARPNAIFKVKLEYSGGYGFYYSPTLDATMAPKVAGRQFLLHLLTVELMPNSLTPVAVGVGYRDDRFDAYYTERNRAPAPTFFVSDVVPIKHTVRGAQLQTFSLNPKQKHMNISAQNRSLANCVAITLCAIRQADPDAFACKTADHGNLRFSSRVSDHRSICLNVSTIGMVVGGSANCVYKTRSHNYHVQAAVLKHIGFNQRLNVPRTQPIDESRVAAHVLLPIIMCEPFTRSQMERYASLGAFNASRVLTEAPDAPNRPRQRIPTLLASCLFTPGAPGVYLYPWTRLVASDDAHVFADPDDTPPPHRPDIRIITQPPSPRPPPRPYYAPVVLDAPVALPADFTGLSFLLCDNPTKPYQHYTEIRNTIVRLNGACYTARHPNRDAQPLIDVVVALGGMTKDIHQSLAPAATPGADRRLVGMKGAFVTVSPYWLQECERRSALVPLTEFPGLYLWRSQGAYPFKDREPATYDAAAAIATREILQRRLHDRLAECRRHCHPKEVVPPAPQSPITALHGLTVRLFRPHPGVARRSFEACFFNADTDPFTPEERRRFPSPDPAAPTAILVVRHDHPEHLFTFQDWLDERARQPHDFLTVGAEWLVQLHQQHEFVHPIDYLWDSRVTSYRDPTLRRVVQCQLWGTKGTPEAQVHAFLHHRRVQPRNVHAATQPPDPNPPLAQPVPPPSSDGADDEVVLVSGPPDPPPPPSSAFNGPLKGLRFAVAYGPDVDSNPDDDPDALIAIMGGEIISSGEVDYTIATGVPHPPPPTILPRTWLDIVHPRFMQAWLCDGNTYVIPDFEPYLLRWDATAYVDAYGKRVRSTQDLDALMRLRFPYAGRLFHIQRDADCAPADSDRAEASITALGGVVVDYTRTMYQTRHKAPASFVTFVLLTTPSEQTNLRATYSRTQFLDASYVDDVVRAREAYLVGASATADVLDGLLQQERERLLTFWGRDDHITRPHPGNASSSPPKKQRPQY